MWLTNSDRLCYDEYDKPLSGAVFFAGVSFAPKRLHFGNIRRDFMHPGHIFMTAFNAVVPIILLILLGYLLRQKGFLTEGFLENGNRLVFKVLLPTMLFINIYHIESLTGIRWDIALYALAAIVVIFCLSLATAIATTPVAERRGVILQCCFRSNFVIIGLPLAASLGGSEAEAVAAVLSAVSIPLFNVLAVISLSVFVGRKESFWQSARHMIRSIVVNPLIIAVALGLVCVSLRWVQTSVWGEVLFRLDTHALFFFDALVTLKNGTTALALMVLGGQFVFSAVKELKKEIIVATLWRVVLSPVIGVGGAILLSRLGLIVCTSADYPALIALFGSPVAVSSAIMAKGMGNDEQLATQLVVWTTILSGITVFLAVCILMAAGLIVQ
jgi:predicted permease